MGDPFEEDSQELVVLDTKEIAPPGAVDALRRAHKVGKVQFDNFVWDAWGNPSTEQSQNLRSAYLKTSGKGQTANEIPQEWRGSILLSVYRAPELGWESRQILPTWKSNLTCPPALVDDGGIQLGVKSDLLACLEDFSQPKSEVPCNQLHCPRWSSHHPVAEAHYSKKLQRVCSIILSKLHQATRLDLVWDHHITDSLNGTARTQRGKRMRRRMVVGATIPDPLCANFYNKKERAVQLPLWHLPRACS